jgi:ribosomal protein L11 methyltransferase
MRSHLWYQISIQLDSSYQDLLIGQLASLGFNGFTQENKSIDCFIRRCEWSNSIQKKFNSVLNRFINEFHLTDLSYKTFSFREQNWNKKWEDSTGIIEATPGIVIKPSWKKLPARHHKKLILHINPKMSFGTGHHETTRLSLRLIEHYIIPGMIGLDFGCGTGILGIACIKLGAKSFIAIDNDEWAYENAKENILRNNVQHQMFVRLGSISSIPRRRFDIVVANIDTNTISRFIKHLVQTTRKQGIMVLSGILISDTNNLLSLFKKYSLFPIEIACENEWASVALIHV